MPLSRLNRFKRPSFDTWPFKETLNFPKGLHGFENLIRFSLIGHKHETPFLRLASEENDAISFVVADPFPLYPFYEPVITKKDVEDLNVGGEAKLIILAIVNTIERPLTLNLEAPLLIHWHIKQGKQLLFPNDPAFPID
jgi:flagellar assembly factor FliW